MGLFDNDENLPDPEKMTIGDAINELMSRAREGQFIQRWYTLINGAYGRVIAIEPEKRSQTQQVIVDFVENISCLTTQSLDWCDQLDDPFHVEEYKAKMRSSALEIERDWAELCKTGDPSYLQVDKYINMTIEGI